MLQLPQSHPPQGMRDSSSKSKICQLFGSIYVRKYMENYLRLHHHTPFSQGTPLSLHLPLDWEVLNLRPIYEIGPKHSQTFLKLHSIQDLVASVPAFAHQNLGLSIPINSKALIEGRPCDRSATISAKLSLLMRCPAMSSALPSPGPGSMP